MDLAALMTEIAERLSDQIPSLTAYPFPPDNITPPAAFPNGDGGVTYSQTTDGRVRVSLPYVVAVARTWAPASWAQLLQFVATAGDLSVPRILELDDYLSCDTLSVAGVEFGTVTMGAVDYVGAIYTLDITGGV